MKKFLKLFCMYIFVTLSVAAGYVFVNGGFSGNTTTTQSNASQNVDPVVNAFMQSIVETSTVSTEVNITLVTESAGSSVDLGIEANINIADILAGRPLNGNIVVRSSVLEYPLYMYTMQNALYVKYNDISLQVNIKEAQTVITQVMQWLQIDINSLVGMDIGAILNPTVLQSMFMGMTSAENDDGTYTLTLNFDGMVTIEFVIDEMYQLQKIQIPETTMQGATFSMNADVQTNGEDFSIETPEGEFKDVTPIIQLAKEMLPMLSHQKFALQVNIPKYSILANGLLEIMPEQMLQAQLNVQYNHSVMQLVLQNNAAYVDVLGMQFCMQMQSLFAMFEEVTQSSVMEDVQQSVNDLLETVKKFTVQDWLQECSIEKTENVYKISIFDTEFFIEIKEEGCACIVNVQDVTVEMQLSKTEQSILEIDPNAYISVDALSHVIPKFLPFIEANTISFDVDYRNNAELYVQGNVAVNIANKSLCANLVLQQIPVQVYIQDETIFITIKGAQIKAGLDDVDAVEDFLQSFGVSVSTQDLQNVFDDILKEVSSFKLFNVIEKDNGVQIDSNMFSLFIGLQETINHIKLEISNHFVAIENITLNSEVVIDVQPEEFVSVSELMMMAEQITAFKNYSQFNALLLMQGLYQLDMSIGLNLDKQMFGISGTFNDKVLGLTMQQYQGASWVFAQYQTIKFGIQKNSIASALTEIGPVVGMSDVWVGLIQSVFSADSFDDIFAMVSSTMLPEFSSTDVNITFEDVISVLQNIKMVRVAADGIEIVLSGKVFSDTNTQDVTFKLQVKEGSLRVDIENMPVSGVPTNISILLQGSSTTPANIQEVTEETFAEYMDLSSIGNFAKSFRQTADIKTFEMSGKVSIATTGSVNFNLADLNMDILIHVYDDLSFDVEINIYDLPIGYMLGTITQNADFVANYSTSNRNLKIVYKDDMVYFKRDVQYKQIFFGSNTYRKIEWEETVAPQTVMDNMAEYMAKAFALTDTIKNTIADAFNKEKDADQSIEAIIPQDAYAYYALENRYALKVNGGNLIGDSNIGLITANIYQRDDGYLYKLEVTMLMVDFLQISLKDLTLTNI